LTLEKQSSALWAAFRWTVDPVGNETVGNETKTEVPHNNQPREQSLKKTKLKKTLEIGKQLLVMEQNLSKFKIACFFLIELLLQKSGAC
jgi:hypothetical protein